jgi:hypothetical protein
MRLDEYQPAVYNERQAREFRKIFKVELKAYWSKLLGFDITRFDGEVIKSGNQSMQAAVMQSYGQDAVTLITELLNQISKFHSPAAQFSLNHVCPTCGGQCRCDVPIQYCVHCA